MSSDAAAMRREEVLTHFVFKACGQERGGAGGVAIEDDGNMDRRRSEYQSSEHADIEAANERKNLQRRLSVVLFVEPVLA